MAFTAKILSWRFRHLNIVGCLLKRRPTKGGSRAPQDRPLATPLMSTHQNDQFKKKLVLFPSILKRTEKIEKSVDIFSVPSLRLLKYTVYLRCLKIHCNFRFR